MQMLTVESAGGLSQQGGCCTPQLWAVGRWDLWLCVLTWQGEVSPEDSFGCALWGGRLALHGVLIHVELVVPLQPHAPARAQ